MNRLLNSLVWILAGALILISVWLSQAVSPWWLGVAFLVSAYLIITGITGYYPVKNYLSKQLGESVDADDDEE